MAAIPVVVSPSWSTLWALLAAPTAGLLMLLLRMVSRSGRIPLSLRVLWRSKSDTAALVLYDVVGGAIAVGSLLLLGVTRPPALISGFRDEPGVAWAIVGMLGPLVSAGVLDRLPLRSVVDFIGRTEQREGRPEQSGSPLVEIRFHASQRILFTLYDEVRYLDALNIDELSVSARKLVGSGRLHFDDVAREIQEFATNWERTVPPPVRDLLERREEWPVGADPGRAVLVLVDACLESGMTRPVGIACRVAARRGAAAKESPLSPIP